MNIKPGFYPDMPMPTYHGHRQSYSRSTIVEYSKSPAHCQAYKEKKETTKHDKFELGTAAHSAILEGIDAYIETVAIVPENVLGKNNSRTTKAYKAWSAENMDKTQLLASQVDQVRGMYEAVAKKEMFKKYLTGGRSEVSAFWEEESAGHRILCKCRPDYLPSQAVVTDLKTTSIALDDWPRYAANSKAHWSAYWTCRGLTRLTGIEHKDYLFAVVEATPPHDCRIYRTSKILFEMAKWEINEILPGLIECDRSGVWPGSDDEIYDLQFPGWALRHLPDHVLDGVDCFA